MLGRKLKTLSWYSVQVRYNVFVQNEEIAKDER